MINADTNIREQVFVWTSIFIYLECIFGSKIAGSYENAMLSILRKCQTVFCSCCTTSLPLSVCASFNFSTSMSTLVIIHLLDYSHSCKCEMALHVVLICISLKINDVEGIFLCLLAHCVSSVDKCLHKSFTHILMGLLVFFL